eukprot:g7290.t1
MLSGPVPVSWCPFVEDHGRRSYSYFAQNAFSQAELETWFHELHPRTYYGSDSDWIVATESAGAGAGPAGTPLPVGEQEQTAWTDAYYKGRLLLRKTAWCVFEKDCVCEYGYSDTWQPQIRSEKMQRVLEKITRRVEEVCFGRGSAEVDHTSSSSSGINFNAVNLNYYPRGGGVGFHADDEFLFDGLNRDTCIISLSLGAVPTERDDTAVLPTSPGVDETSSSSSSSSRYYGARKFQIRLKKKKQKVFPAGQAGGGVEIADLVLFPGDLMTMEGEFQKHYLHSVWPGDDPSQGEHELTQGERINLTWRKIVRHLDGSAEECKGIKCPLAGT